jgi:hypothetical protein
MLRCPACAQPLSRFREGTVELDVCREGCGGIWFDGTELEKILGGATISQCLLRVRSNKNSVTDFSKTRLCARCPSQPLDRHYESRDDSLEIDDCPVCAGAWLDLGELPYLQALEEQKKTAERIMSDYQRSASSSRASRGVRAVLELIFK